MSLIKRHKRLEGQQRNGSLISLYRDGMRAQRSTALHWFRVIKWCGYRETKNFLFFVPSPIIILQRRRLLLILLFRKV